MKIRARIIAGTLTYNIERFKQLCAENEGRWVNIEVEQSKRSLSQNNYYWLYLGVIEQETGQNANDVHEWAKRRFLPPRFIKVQGQELKIPASTTDLDKATFTAYLDKIASETGVPLPDPITAGFLPS